MLGAATVAEVEGWLHEAGFIDVAIREKPRDRRFLGPRAAYPGQRALHTFEAQRP